MLKTIVVACGAGTVSSALMSAALGDLLRRNGLAATIIYCRCDRIKRYQARADLILTSVSLPDTLNVPVLVGTPLITGRGSAQLECDIIKALGEGL